MRDYWQALRRGLDDLLTEPPAPAPNACRLWLAQESNKACFYCERPWATHSEKAQGNGDPPPVNQGVSGQQVTE